MRDPGPRTPRWPARIKELCQRLPSSPDSVSRESIRAELWLLINASIARYLRLHSTRLGVVAREEMEDIAAEKSFDLLRRIETGENDMGERQPAEIASYLSRVARNGLLDQLREAARRVLPADEDCPEWELGGDALLSDAWERSPEQFVARREFATALHHCARALAVKSRRIWLLRAFCDMPSRQIATHPAVDLNVGHVDVLLQRSRRAIRKCMKVRGHNPADAPPGVMIELWEALWGTDETGDLN